MDPALKIRRDLAAGRSTASSIAGRYKLHPDAVQAILTRLETEGIVKTKTISDFIKVYELTEPPSSSSLKTEN